MALNSARKTKWFPSAAPMGGLLCLCVFAGIGPAAGAVKMPPAEDYPHAGVSLAIPEGFEAQAVNDPFDVARAVLAENNKPVQAVTLSCYPIAEKVTAERFADAMLADLQKMLAISKLSVNRKSTLQVAGVESQVRLLSFEYRGAPTSAIKVFFTREEKHAAAADGTVRLCYVLTAESTVERQGTLAGVLGEVIKTVKFVPIQPPAAVGAKDLGLPVRDYRMGYVLRPPAHWYTRLTPSGVEAGLTDYVLGGVPMPLLRLAVTEAAAAETPEQASKKIVEALQQNAAADGQELKVASEGASTLGALEARQVVLNQEPASRPARLKGDEEPAVHIAYRTTGVVEVSGRPPRTYWLAVYCQSADAAGPLSILTAVADSFQALPAAPTSASAPAGSSGPAASTSCPATGPATTASAPATGVSTPGR